MSSLATLVDENEMAALVTHPLEDSLAHLRLSTPLPPIESADRLTKPLDVYRSYLAEILSRLVEGSFDAAYKSIHWPNNIDSGDLTVTLPKLCPGCNASEVAMSLARKVCFSTSQDTYSV